MLSEGIRIRFSKTGKLKYISHLDLCRTFRSAFKRARIPIWYSQGFNPHPKMVFATTVSVGHESLCELLDIKITSPMSREELISRLQSALTEEIGIIDTYKSKRKFTELRYAGYEIFTEEELTNEEVQRAVLSPMVIIKRTKSGEKETDIKPMIHSYKKDGKALTTDGALAGSTLELADGIRNLVRFAGISLEKAIPCATRNPAAMLKLDDCGTIEVSKRADLLVITEDDERVFEIKNIVLNGEFVKE